MSYNLNIQAATSEAIMAKTNSCGGPKRPGRKTVPVKPHRRGPPGNTCYGPGKPGPKTVPVKPHKRSKP